MKIALVTGASRGLGLGFVKVLESMGYMVYAGVHTLDPNLKSSSHIKYLRLDVENDQSIAQAIAQIKTEQGHLDLLINNAGIDRTSAAPDQPDKANTLGSLDRSVLQTMFNVNAIGPLMVTKHAAPVMTGPDCFIINISSDRASFAVVFSGGANYGYRASETALNMFTWCLPGDLPPNISIFAVHPGWVHTDMSPNGPLEPEDAATRVLSILNHWDPSLNGHYLSNDGSPHEL